MGFARKIAMTVKRKQMTVSTKEHDERRYKCVTFCNSCLGETTMQIHSPIIVLRL